MIYPKFKRTKILATIGPASSNAECIYELLASGVNGCRLNFSHGDYQERIEQIKLIRQASAEIGKPVAILQDLQGPKIRLGEFNDDELMAVEKGQELILDSEITYDPTQPNIIPVQYNLASKVKVGEEIFIFDGRVKSEVIEIVSDVAIKIRIKNNGFIQQRKGLNLPDTNLSGDILTKKDLRDIEFGATQDIDYVALSFVQSADDIQNLRQILLSHNSEAQIIAKIETKRAISDENMEEIVKQTDGIMVARGDLAVETGAEVVPIVQEKLIQLCRKHGKLVIVATQMMSSMVESPEPTRAEVSDVANAVRQGVDAVMLSEETANGKYPAEAVKAMKKVILYTQDNLPVYRYNDYKEKTVGESQKLDAISEAAVEIADHIDSAAIVVETKSGATAARVAAARPNRVILSVTDNRRVAQQLALSFANQSYIRHNNGDSGLELARELKRAGRFEGDERLKVVIVSGRQPGVVGATDTVQVRMI